MCPKEQKSSTSPPEYERIYRPAPPFGSTPFDSSAFDYRPFTSRITQAFDILASGAVLAIDAPWGHGKTFFGLNLNADLKGKGWRTVYIDAFEHDYIDDPFILLASIIKEQATDGAKRRGLVKAASAAGKALFPIVAKAAVKAATLGALDTDQVAEAGKAIVDASGDAASKLVEARISEFEANRKSLNNFREKLAEVAQAIKAATGHPLVVFIDELDRCRPDFAIRTLERMKHLFDVPSLVFVLLLNKRQLENAAKGVYGASLDAEAYLRKFIHLTFQLPLRLSTKEDQRTEIGAYPSHLANQINLGENQRLLPPFVEAMSRFAPTMGLSFRDVERCFTEFVVATLPAKISPKVIQHLAFIVALRVAHPGVYHDLVERKPGAKRKVTELLDAAHARGLDDPALQSVRSLVFLHLGDKISEDEIGGLRQFFFEFHVEVEHFFTVLASLIDSRIGR